MRRLLGPVGGPVTFFLVAALVFAGLGWVTVAALRVEEAQREAAAQAELGNNLRVALWRLDGRMLPALGVEDSRPFYHYNSADPLSGYAAGPTPLLGAPLPDWMKLHVQLDPATGWESPQVLSPDARDRVSNAWPELSLRNNTADRAAVYNALKGKYPPHPTWEFFAARDRAAPSDGRPFATPLVDPQPGEPIVVVPPSDPALKPPPPPGMGPSERSGDPFRLFGWELARRDIAAGNYQQEEKQGAQRGQDAAPIKRAAFPPTAPPAGGAVGRGFPPLTEKEMQQWREFRNRAMTIQRGTEEAKNAGQDFPNYGKGLYQNVTPPGNNTQQPTTPPNGLAPVGPPAPSAGDAKGDRDGKDKPPGTFDASVVKPGVEKLKGDERGKDERFNDALRRLRSEQFRGTFAEHLATLSLGLDRRRSLDEVEFDDGRKQPADNDANAVLKPGPRFVPAAEERPLPNLNNALPPGARPTNIHLGSMRPQWITAADGTEMLFLVRAAQIDGKVVYQGVILDWVKLERVLKDEVKDLFPDAKLVPVKDPLDVSPDRAMTALPVQLETGVSATPPPAGWTPLRIGLVLAWVAALVAFAAVGFSGWSLIDLAERRIRFVSGVTHELRTPLTSLRIYLDLLMSGMIHDEAKRQEYLNTLATESDRLHRLIDNVLDFAKLEKRAKNGDMRPVKVSELTEQIKNTWADRVAADGKELVVIATLAETEVFTDPAMVYQIVGNLIDNARKYTRDAEDKRIWLWVKPSANGRVVFEVEDRGCGVPPGERKSIFRPFRRGAQADAKAGGAGLGLALAKQWAEVLGGTVAYRPAAGAPGACFRLELPKM